MMTEKKKSSQQDLGKLSLTGRRAKPFTLGGTGVADGN